VKFAPALIPATLIKRYKRFLADVRLDNGEELTVHTPNTGSMLGCAEPGTRIWLRDSANPQRKYRYSWEIASTPAGVAIGINTHLANQLVREAVESAVLTRLQGYDSIRNEVKYGSRNSRIDLKLSAPSRPDCYVEVKNVTAVVQTDTAMFPDAPSERGRKHLQELMEVVQAGERAMMVFNIQRDDAQRFRPADEIDPAYGELLREAMQTGVEIEACVAKVTPDEIRIYRTVPVILS